MLFNRTKIRKVTGKSTGECGCSKTNICSGFISIRDTISERACKLIHVIGFCRGFSCAVVGLLETMKSIVLNFL